MALIWHILLKIGLISISIITLSTAKFTKNDTQINYDLPYNSLIPLHYDVKLTFDLYKCVFFGETNITFQIYRQKINIAMPSVIFGILEIYLTDKNHNQINVTKYTYINKTVIQFDFTNSSLHNLTAGTYILRMIYVGSIFDDRNFCGSLDGDDILSKTDIVKVWARQIFPCWDTLFKVTYTLSVIHQKKYTILSNMPIQKKVEDKNSMIWTHFDKSSPILPQHIMILITTLTNIYSYTNLTYINVTFWCRWNMINHIRFAENIVQKIVHFLESKSQFTNITKLDYVVIWDSQHSTETSGLVLIREEDITYNEELDPAVRKLEVANLISRQVIHLWYNNVFLWQKEGFSTLIGVYVLHKIPLYLPDVMELFVVRQQQESLRFDTPSIIDFTLNCNRNISTDDSIQLSPHLYYFKSSVIWYMLLYLLPHNAFWTSIQQYIEQQMKQNETIRQSDESIDNLWNIMQIALNNYSKIPLKFDIKSMVNTMIAEKQYPIVYVTHDRWNNVTVFSYLSCNYTDNDNNNNNKTKQHPVLVTYTKKSFVEEEFTYKYFWLCRGQKKYIHLDLEDDWIIVNFAQPEYYRVYYDFSNWIKLAHYLNSEDFVNIDVLKRAKIVDDAFHFLVHRQFNYTLFWDLLSFLPRNTNYIVWYPMIKAFEYMICTFPFYDILEITNMRKNVQQILGDLLDNIGYYEKHVESDLIKYLREEAVRWACVFDVPKCRTTVTSNLYLRHSLRKNSVAWKEWMYCTSLIQANSSIWNDMWNEWEKTSDSRFLEYLTCCEDPIIIINYLTQIKKNDSLVKVQYNKRANLFLLIIARHTRNNKIFDFILDNFFEFNLMQEEKISTIIVMLSHMYDVYQFDKMSTFIAKNANNLTILDVPIKRKMKKRRMEHQKQISKYGSLMLAVVNIKEMKFLMK